MRTIPAGRGLPCGGLAILLVLLVPGAAATQTLDARVADLALTMTVDDPAPEELGEVLFTVTLVNQGPDDVAGIEVDETWPAGLSPSGFTASQGTYNQGTEVWQVDGLAAGDSATLELQASVMPGTAGRSITNIAVVGAMDAGDPQPADNVAFATLQVDDGGELPWLRTGSYLGDGSGARGIGGLGFAPDAVIVQADGGSGAVCRTSSMPADAVKHLAAAQDLAADRILSLDADGFTLGSDADCNASGVAYHWVAFRAAPGRLAVGSYLGNAMVSREITGIGFAPDHVVVMSAGAAPPWQRFVDMVGDVSVTFADEPVTAGRITALTADGFRVGQDAGTNAPGGIYHYVAWGSDPGRVATGWYVGQGNDDRDVAAAGFQPDYVLIKAAEKIPGAHRTASLGAGDATLDFGPSPVFADGIQALLAAGFQVGTSPRVNETGVPYFWTAYRDGSEGADLAVSLAVDDSYPDLGDPVLLTVEIANLGPGSASGVQVLDVLPEDLVFAGALPSQGTYDPGSGLWNVGSLAAGDPATLLLDATMDLGTPGGSVVNVASVTAAGQSDPDPGNNSAAVVLSVPSADLVIEKSVHDPTPPEGGTVRFLVTVANDGPQEGTGVVVADLLPAGLVLESADPDQGVYDPGSGLWTVGDLTVDESAALTLECVVAAGTSGETITNVAAVAAAGRHDPDPGNDSDGVEITVQGTDLRVEKTVDEASPYEGATITFTVRVVNDGSGLATGVALLDQLPEGLTFVAASPGQGGYDQATGFWSVGALAAGDSATLELEAVVDAGTAESVLINTAQLADHDQDDPDPDNDSAAAGVLVLPSEAYTILPLQDSWLEEAQPDANHGADPELYCRTQAGAAAGPVLQFDLSAIVPGSTIHRALLQLNVKRKDSSGLPVRIHRVTESWAEMGVSWASAADAYDPVTVHGSILPTVSGPVAADVTALVQAWVDGDQPNHGFRLLATSDGIESQYDSREDTEPSKHPRLHILSTATVDLAVTKVVDDPAPNEGDAVTFTVTVINDGPHAATGVALTDLLPAGLGFASAVPGQGSYEAGGGVWTVGALAVGGSAVLDLTATVEAGIGGATLVNTAAVTALDQTDPAAGNDADTASVTVRSADLRLVKTVDEPSPNEGDPVTFTVTLENLGPDDATGVQVTDLLPAGLTFAAAAPDQGGYAEATGLWDVGALAAGMSAALELTATVDVGTGGMAITNTATITATDQADPEPDNNSSSSGIGVESADLAVSKVVDAGTADEGDPVVFTITVVNNGPAAAAGVQIDDPLPAGLDFAGATPSQGGYEPGTGIWDVGALGVGGSATLDLAATVAAGAVGTTLTNTAAVAAADQADPVGGNNAADAEVAVPGADLQLTKEADAALADVGDTVTFTVTVLNAGPDPATGVAITDLLPAGLALAQATPGQGTYAPGTGLWSVGDLADGFAAVLTLAATVEPGTSGTTLTNTAAVTAADQADPDADNDVAAAQVAIRAVDLEVSLLVNAPPYDEGDAIGLSVQLTNHGPHGASGIQVTDLLPAGLTLTGAVASRGSYDGGSGIWTVGSLGAGTGASLFLNATVDEGTGGTSLVNTAAVTALDQSDPLPDNDTDTVILDILSADLELSKVVDQPDAGVGDDVEFTVTVTNLGPDPATGVAVTDLLPEGLSLAFAVPDRGGYDPGTGVWLVGELAPGEKIELVLLASVDAGTGGRLLVNAASVTASDRADPQPDNDADTATVAVELPPGRILVRPLGEVPLALLPGGTARLALDLEVVNDSAWPDTIRALSLTNDALGPGTREQLDRDWEQLELAVTDASGLAPAAPHEFDAGGLQFRDGRLSFADLDVALAPGDTVRLQVRGRAALGARDSDLLRVRLESDADLACAQAVKVVDAEGDLVATDPWPLSAQRELQVDGFTADQLTLTPVPAAVFPVGSTRNLALDVALPANGYVGDVLERLNVVNIGTAAPATDVAAIEAWAESGRTDGFDPAEDVRLGAFAFTGDRWELTGLSHVVPLEGLRVYVSADVAQGAAAALTLRLGLPTLPDVGIGMASGNDGPIDRAVYNPEAQSISEADRVILAADPVAGGAVRPGTADLLLLRLTATNTYPDARELTGLTVTNATTGAAGGGQAERDAAVTRLQLWWDDDGDGNLSGGDALLGTSGFAAGRAVFSGFGGGIAAGETEHLFLTGDLALQGVADGDVVAAVVANGLDLQWAEATAAVAGWPLDSGARWAADGMVAVQLRIRPVPPVALTAGDGPILALDVTIPPNGYAADELNGLALANLGTAGVDDIAELALWADGGDTLFDAGAGDDVALGAFTWTGDRWLSPALSTPVLAPTGLRLYAGLTVSLTPTDSATVQLAVPVGGVTMGSNNDGPYDEAVANPDPLLLSTAPLLATLEFGAARSTIGQDVPVRMVVRNVGGEAVLGTAPSALSAQGDGSLTLLAGPVPASLDLATGAVDTFHWTYRAAAVGELALSGSCEGTGAVGGLPRRSLPATSGAHEVRRPVDHLQLYPVANMPFSITRGQKDVIPLTLTLVNQPGGDDVAAARLDRLRIRLEDDGGADVIPAELLDRIVVGEGANTYLVKTALETSGGEIDLALSTPVLITGLEPVSIALRLDIAADTTVPVFRVVIESSLWFEARDNISGAPVSVVLQESTYPVATGNGRLVDEATELVVTPGPATPQQAGRGQADVPLLVLQLDNPGVEELTSDIALGELAIGLTDTVGVPLTEPARYLERIRLIGPYQVLADRALTAADDTTLLLVLSPPLTVPVNNPMQLTVGGDIAADADLGAFRVVLADTALVDARDANTGTAVGTRYVPPAIAGTPILVQAPATSLLATGTGLLPRDLTIGAQDVGALELILRHPGGSEQGAIRCDSLTVQCLDPLRQPLSPAGILDRLGIERDGVPLVEVDAPAAADGRIGLPLGGQELVSGESATLRLVIDVEAGAPATGFELLVEGGALVAVDANLGSPLAVIPEAGAAFPFSSGLTRLQAPADELLVGCTDLMPAALAADGREVTVLGLELTNPAAPGVGDIRVESLTLRAADADLAGVPLGAAAATVRAYGDGDPWAEATGLAPQDTLVLLAPAAPLVVAAGQSVGLELRLVLHGTPSPASLRLGIAEEDIGVEQPHGALLAVHVVPADGQFLPFWTEPGHLTDPGLAASYSNFPNPFAAGREATRFVYSLPQEARVTLRLLTARGETVVELLDEAWRGPGLHQDDSWDGRNGRGATVRNGVYVAELVARFADGSVERIRRKVAVVR